MLKFPLFIVVSLFCFLIDSAYAQDIFSAKFTKTDSGAIIAFKNSQHALSLFVKGKSLRQLPKKGIQNYLDVDSQVLQYLAVPFQQKVDYDSFSDKMKQDFLLDYEGYEMDYIKELLKEKNLNEETKFLNLNNRVFLMWHYDMPKVEGKSNVLQQCYLVTACFNTMVVLNIPVQGNLEDTKKFLSTIGNTLQIIK